MRRTPDAGFRDDAVQRVRPSFSNEKNAPFLPNATPNALEAGIFFHNHGDNLFGSFLCEEVAANRESRCNCIATL